MNKFEAAMMTLADELRDEPRWSSFASYLEQRAQGARGAALQAAEHFAEDARYWPYEDRKRFGLWLLNRSGDVIERIGSARHSERGRSFVSPEVVTEMLLIPMLEEWIEREPEHPEPRFWIALYSYTSASNRNPTQLLQEAIRLDPHYAPAREALARRLLASVEYHQHELPSGYLGDGPERDLTRLQEAGSLIAGLNGLEGLVTRISELQSRAEDAIRDNPPHASLT